MRRWFAALLGCGLLALYATTATAVDFADGWYWGASLGASEESNACGDAPSPTGTTKPATCDDKDASWQLFLGYQIWKWLSVEGGYTDLGGSSVQNVSQNISTDTTGWTLGAVVTAPVLERIGLYGIAGAIAWDREKKTTDLIAPTEKISDTGTDYYFGAGLRFPLTDRIAINAEAKQFQDLGNSKVGKTDYRVYSAGFLFRF